VKPPSTPDPAFSEAPDTERAPAAGRVRMVRAAVPSPVRRAAPEARAAGAPRTGGAPVAADARRGTLGRQVVIFAVGVVAAVILVAAITGDRGYLDVRRQKAMAAKLQAETASLHQENSRLISEVRALRTNSYVIEKLAREKLGYARPGEITFRFPPTEPPVKPTAPPRPPGGG